MPDIGNYLKRVTGEETFQQDRNSMASYRKRGFRKKTYRREVAREYN